MAQSWGQHVPCKYALGPPTVAWHPAQAHVGRRPALSDMSRRMKSLVELNVTKQLHLCGNLTNVWPGRVAHATQHLQLHSLHIHLPKHPNRSDKTGPGTHRAAAHHVWQSLGSTSTFSQP